MIGIQRCRELAKRDEETKQAASQDVSLNAASALFRSSALFTLLTFGAWEKCSALGWAALGRAAQSRPGGQPGERRAMLEAWQMTTLGFSSLSRPEANYFSIES